MFFFKIIICTTSWFILKQLSYVYTLRLIGPISYRGECDLMVHQQKYSVIFSRLTHKSISLPSYVYNMHQDTKSARLIAVCKRSLKDTYTDGFKSMPYHVSGHVSLFSCPQNTSINHLSFYCIKQIDYISRVCVL